MNTFLGNCPCPCCQSIDAADHLINAGICSDYETSLTAIKAVLPFPSDFTDPKNATVLSLLAGHHGVTVYKMLMARSIS